MQDTPPHVLTQWHCQLHGPGIMALCALCGAATIPTARLSEAHTPAAADLLALSSWALMLVIFRVMLCRTSAVLSS